MTRRDRRDGPPERGRDGQQERVRESQPERDHEHSPAESEIQEGERESLVALKGILAKVASVLRPLQLTPDESMRLVEQMYESVLAMDVKLAGESDDTRKSMVIDHIQNAVIRRDNERLVVDYPST